MTYALGSGYGKRQLGVSMFVSFLVHLLIVTSTAQADDTCISKDQAAQIGAELFVAEYFGQVQSQVFDGFYEHFYYGSFSEDLPGALSAFFSDDYKFSQQDRTHRFTSTGSSSSAHQDYYYVSVTCEGMVSTKFATEHD